jgi:hypothetical protein
MRRAGGAARGTAGAHERFKRGEFPEGGAGHHSHGAFDGASSLEMVAPGREVLA